MTAGFRLFSCITLLLSLSACFIKAPSSDSSSSPVSISDLSCSTSLIDTGQKGVVAGTIRGSFSDTKMIPGTSNFATAFVDQSNLVIKLVYSNGSKNITEVISGDGTGAWVRLAFTSNGTPYIFWTLGGNVKVAIRSAPISTAGASWTGGVIDTGTAPRALEVSVNPLDQILLSFVTDTAVAGRPKMLYCDVGCTAVTDFQTMTTNPFIENTNVVAAIVGTGAAWCQVSANQYYPTVAYNVTGQTKFAVCRQASLANCLNGANWTTQSVVAAGNTDTKLLIDSTVTGDIPKVASAGAALTVYSMGASPCTGAPAAFTAGGGLGAYGTSWISFLKDPTNGKFHLIANSTTTAVEYLNSQTTNPIGAWNAVGTVDTVTLPAVGAVEGGAAINSYAESILVSYGINIAGFDMKLSTVGNYTTASNAQTFTHSIPDLTGMVQMSPAAGGQLKNIAVASNPSGVPAVAYVDFSAGTAITGKLKFAQRNGASSKDSWDVFVVADTVSPQSPGLAFDQNGRPWISFYDPGTVQYDLATNSASDGSGAWSLYQFPAVPGGAAAVLPAANNTAMAMYYSGGVSYPVMIVTDTSATNKVEAATFNPLTSNWYGAVQTVGTPTGAGRAAHLSADFDTKGNVVVAYQDLTSTQAMYTYQTGINSWANNAPTSIIPVAVSTAARGVGTSIRINPATSEPSITYYDSINNAVYYATCSNTIANCASGGWTSVKVESAAGVSGLTAATGQLLTTSLVFNSSGDAQILYPRGAGNDGNLIMTQNYNGSWASQIASSGSNGATVGAPVLNFGIAGWNIQATTNTAGGVSGAFIGPGNWLYAVSCGD